MSDYTSRVTRGDLFAIFLRAGLAFGGGLGILAVLEQELVNKRRAVTTDEFLTIHGIINTCADVVAVCPHSEGLVIPEGFSFRLFAVLRLLGARVDLDLRTFF